MSSKIINLSLPADLVKKIDQAAKDNYASRSDFIRESIVLRLHNKRIVDDYGDEGHWETVADFSKQPGGGMPAREFLQRLKQLDGQN